MQGVVETDADGGAVGAAGIVYAHSVVALLLRGEGGSLGAVTPVEEAEHVALGGDGSPAADDGVGGQGEMGLQHHIYCVDERVGAVLFHHHGEMQGVNNGKGEDEHVFIKEGEGAVINSPCNGVVLAIPFGIDPQGIVGAEGGHPRPDVRMDGRGIVCASRIADGCGGPIDVVEVGKLSNFL